MRFFSQKDGLPESLSSHRSDVFKMLFNIIGRFNWLCAPDYSLYLFWQKKPEKDVVTIQNATNQA